MSRTSFLAGGNINPCSMVRMANASDSLSPDDNFQVMQATGTSNASALPIFGVATDAIFVAPLNLTGYTPSTYAAIAGIEFRVFLPGEECQLYVAGTVAAGDLLIPDSNGYGVTAGAISGTAQWYGFQTWQAGTACNVRGIVRFGVLGGH